MKTHTKLVPNSLLTPRHLPRQMRPGYLYVAVLFTTLIVMATVSVSLSVSTANLRAENNRNARSQALRLAESEIHRLAAKMRTSSQWRTDSINNEFSPWRDWTIGLSTSGLVRQVRHRYNDADSVLNDSLIDSAELTVHARVGDAETAVSVTLESDPSPLELLGYSVTCSNDLDINSGGTLTAERAVQVAGDCLSTSGMLTTPRLECGGLAEVTLRGDLAASSVSLPSYNVLTRYAAVGTQIPLASIPQSNGERMIQDVVLSPNVNPYGTVDAGGIYWINASGQTVRIANCRLNATLVITNANEIILSGGLTWSYPVAPEAILVSDSPIQMEDLEATLNESNRNVNFNPAGSPYRETLTNSTAVDIYPTELRGLIYSTQDIVIEPLVDGATLSVVGSILAADLQIKAHVTVRQLDEWIDSPPIGFSNRVPMRFVRGTFRRIPSP